VYFTDETYGKNKDSTLLRISRIEELSGVYKVSGRHAVCYASLRI